MKVGAEPRKLAILGVLLVVAGYFVYTGVFSTPSTPAAPPTQAPPKASTARPENAPEVGRPAPRPEVRETAQGGASDFRPSLKPRQAVERGDISSVEATLRLDLLARLRDVGLQGGERSLFEFSAPPLPKNAEPKVVPAPRIQTVAPPPPPPPDPVKPPPPPIPLKFYGWTQPFRQGAKRAFFLDGEEILVGAEGEVLKKRYRVVRIGVNSVVMEDLQYKSEQTLPLEPQVG
jgi:hypothetical protein